MSPSEVATLLVSVATLLSALAALVSSLRNAAKLEKTHQLVNGQSEGIQALREAKGRSEGIDQGIGQERRMHPS